MVQPDAPDCPDEVTAERVRQAEVRLGAQVTFLAAAYHRGAVLSGVLFAVVAALFGVAVKNWGDWLHPPLMGKLAAALTLSLILVASSTALSTVSLPGAIDSFDGAVTKNDLQRRLLDSYSIAGRQNARRLNVSKHLFRAAFAVMAIVIAGGALVARTAYISDRTARTEAGDCWWGFADDERAYLREGARPRGGLLDKIADFIGEEPVPMPDSVIFISDAEEEAAGRPTGGYEGGRDQGPSIGTPAAGGSLGSPVSGGLVNNPKSTGGGPVNLPRESGGGPVSGPRNSAGGSPAPASSGITNRALTGGGTPIGTGGTGGGTAIGKGGGGGGTAIGTGGGGGGAAVGTGGSGPAVFSGSATHGRELGPGNTDREGLGRGNVESKGLGRGNPIRCDIVVQVRQPR
jgi:hypothetical protein